MRSWPPRSASVMTSIGSRSSIGVKGLGIHHDPTQEEAILTADQLYEKLVITVSGLAVGEARPRPAVDRSRG